MIHIGISSIRGFPLEIPLLGLQIFRQRFEVCGGYDSEKSLIRLENLGNVAASDFWASPVADKVRGGWSGESTHSLWTRQPARQKSTHCLTPPLTFSAALVVGQRCRHGGVSVDPPIIFLLTKIS